MKIGKGKATEVITGEHKIEFRIIAAIGDKTPHLGKIGGLITPTKENNKEMGIIRIIQINIGVETGVIAAIISQIQGVAMADHVVRQAIGAVIMCVIGMILEGCHFLDHRPQTDKDD